MGTYTKYKLVVSIKDSDKQKYNVKDIISHLRTECEEAEWALNEDGTTTNETKWYEADNDVKEFSKKYPDVLFSLYREKEVLRDDYDDDYDYGDEEIYEVLEWETYFKDGAELS